MKMELEQHIATENDLDLLAEWNRQLILDEGHRNPMALPELRERMRRWLAGEYRVAIFRNRGEPVAYALFRENATEVHLRHLFVRRDCRREGIGRAAIEILSRQIWPRSKRLTVEVLTTNAPAVAFWRSVGYRDYCLLLEMLPETASGRPASSGADQVSAE